MPKLMKEQEIAVAEDKEVATSKETLVEVTGLSKKFCKDLKTSLWYGVKDLIAGYSGNKKKRELRPKEFWAVKDISFTLKRGECLGLIGHNGAGKSTLLKILNGLINPDEGKVVMRGRVGALIELGAGFNPVLSGRENIYNNGAILGFTRKEIDEKLQHIIDFAELEEFIDMPVRNYSSGMKVRLGFAVAAQMEPDVLIIDEVLAVGDLGFVLKCFKTIDTILPNTAIIFVSHSMPMVSRICNQIILMDKGQAKFQGEDVSKAIDLYYTRFASNDVKILYTDNNIVLDYIHIKSHDFSDGLFQINWNDDIQIELKITSKLDKIPVPYITIFDKEQRPVAQLEPFDGIFESIDKRNLTYVFYVKNLQLSKGIYNMNLIVGKAYGKNPFLRINDVLSFQVKHNLDVWPPLLIKTKTTLAK
ncbi:ABC transporter ATP-binding protein [Psychroflexus salinarum]|uniref:ABC transporter ATP-binding protein n=1 Tax=Psychroflexus salinarum TaxID=546024 RepID=A0ABW3GST0_9FLAO